MIHPREKIDQVSRRRSAGKRPLRFHHGSLGNQPNPPRKKLPRDCPQSASPPLAFHVAKGASGLTLMAGEGTLECLRHLHGMEKGGGGGKRASGEQGGGRWWRPSRIVEGAQVIQVPLREVEHCSTGHECLMELWRRKYTAQDTVLEIVTI